MSEDNPTDHITLSKEKRIIDEFYKKQDDLYTNIEIALNRTTPNKFQDIIPQSLDLITQLSSTPDPTNNICLEYLNNIRRRANELHAKLEETHLKLCKNHPTS